jgi:hypothetical protein
LPPVRQTVASAILALLVLTQCTAADAPPEPLQDQADIQLMTSLPLVWGDGASMESILSGDSKPAPVYRYWQDRYDIAPVDSLENLAQDDPDIVILAQPRAMDPADLADLDVWVRAGGAVIIFTDPDLVWPSPLPLGDPRRPLASGLLSPLLGHWGLELVAPGEDRGAAADFRIGQHGFRTRGAGKLVLIATKESPDVRCQMGVADFIAQCSVGRGQATIVADADFLNAALWPESSRLSPQDSGAVGFVDSLIGEYINREDRSK